ncbi:hypothetical protein B0B52_16725 [Polaromonas sp. A23]|nr:hypothetical protein B0B52_16725 [Polaromonas sp. A23]
MKRLALATIAVLLVLVTARTIYVYSETTYVNTFGPECITVRDSLNSVTRDFLDKYPECRTVATGIFHGAGYVHNECGNAHLVSGSHVTFDKKPACMAFAASSAEERTRVVGDLLGRK